VLTQTRRFTIRVAVAVEQARIEPGFSDIDQGDRCVESIQSLGIWRAKVWPKPPPSVLFCQSNLPSRLPDLTLRLRGAVLPVWYRELTGTNAFRSTVVGLANGRALVVPQPSGDIGEHELTLWGTVADPILVYRYERSVWDDKRGYVPVEGHPGFQLFSFRECDSSQITGPGETVDGSTLFSGVYVDHYGGFPPIVTTQTIVWECDPDGQHIRAYENDAVVNFRVDEHSLAIEAPSPPVPEKLNTKSACVAEL
jgi:hypothetical protein